jgi:hypothetical protein
MRWNVEDGFRTSGDGVGTPTFALAATPSRIQTECAPAGRSSEPYLRFSYLPNLTDFYQDSHPAEFFLESYSSQEERLELQLHRCILQQDELMA